MLLTFLVIPVLFALVSFSWFGSYTGADTMLVPYYAGAVVPLGCLALASYVRLRTARGAWSRTATVLAVLLCLVYVAPVLFYGYAFSEA